MNVIFFEKQDCREIPGCQGYYVSIDGIIVSRRGQGRLHNTPIHHPRKIKTYIDKDGYSKFSPRIAGRRSHRFVHSSVLEAWRGPCPDGMECRHLDGVKSNMHVSNLEWGTKIQNGRDKAKHGRVKGEGNHRHKMTEQDVIKLRSEYLHAPLSALCRGNPQWSKFAIWAAVSGYTWSHLPGAIPKNRRCSKDGWRAGERVR
jgi:hypothetical protein